METSTPPPGACLQPNHPDTRWQESHPNHPAQQPQPKPNASQNHKQHTHEPHESSSNFQGQIEINAKLFRPTATMTHSVAGRKIALQDFWTLMLRRYFKSPTRWDTRELLILEIRECLGSILHHVPNDRWHSMSNGHTSVYLRLCVQIVKTGSEVWLSISAETGMSPTLMGHGYSEQTGRSSHHPDFKCLPANQYRRYIKFARKGMA